MEASGAQREIVEATLALLPVSPAPKTVIQLPREYRAMYARELLNHFAADADVASDLAQLYSHYKPWLEGALAMRASWDGEHQRLEDALWLGYRAFEDLDAIAAFGTDARAADLEMTRAIRACNDAMVGWGIRAEWAGALLLAALLRHTLRERCLPPELMPTRVELWPAGPSLVTELPAEFAGRLSWDPCAESKSAARQRMHGTIDGWLEEIEEARVGLGRTTSQLRTVQRDAEATYLRLRDPHRWHWSRLSERYSGVQCVTPISTNGIKQAITRVAAVIEVELPEIARGHPRETF